LSYKKIRSIPNPINKQISISKDSLLSYGKYENVRNRLLRVELVLKLGLWLESGMGKIDCNRYSLLFCHRKYQRLYFLCVVIEYAFFFTFFLRNRFSLLFILQYQQICDFDSFSSDFLSTSV